MILILLPEMAKPITHRFRLLGTPLNWPLHVAPSQSSPKDALVPSEKKAVPVIGEGPAAINSTVHGAPGRPLQSSSAMFNGRIPPSDAEGTTVPLIDGVAAAPEACDVAPVVAPAGTTAIASTAAD